MRAEAGSVCTPFLNPSLRHFPTTCLQMHSTQCQPIASQSPAISFLSHAHPIHFLGHSAPRLQAFSTQPNAASEKAEQKKEGQKKEPGAGGADPNPWEIPSGSAEELYGLVDDSQSKPPPSGLVAVTEKVKEASYFVVGVIGSVAAIAVVGGALFMLFSPSSPQGLANTAASKVKQSQTVVDLLGPVGGIQTYGFGTRRRNIYPLREFKNVSGEDTRLSTFFMRGSKAEAEVTAQWVKRDGDWLFEFLQVEISGHGRIVLIANCHEYLK